MSEKFTKVSLHILVFILQISLLFVSAYVSSVLWLWFMVPLGLIEISMLDFIGVHFFTGWIFNASPSLSFDKLFTEKMTAILPAFNERPLLEQQAWRIFTFIVFCCVTLGFGYILHQIIG